MAEEKKHHISPKMENFIKGLFVALFCILLGLNVEPVSRVFAFPLIYFFGGSYYFILAYFLFRGIYRIFAGKKFKFKRMTDLIAVIVILLALNQLIGYIWATSNNISYSVGGQAILDSYNAGLSTYFKGKFLNLFAKGSYWSNGMPFLMIGVYFAHAEIMLVLFITLFIIGAGLLAAPYIINYVSKRKGNQVEKKADKENKEVATVKQEDSLINSEEKVSEEGPTKVGFEPEDDSFAIGGGDFAPMSLDEAYESDGIVESGNSDFVRPMFDSTFPSFSKEIVHQEAIVEKVEEPIVENEEAFEESIIPSSVEEINNFAMAEEAKEEPSSDLAKPQIDESLATIQPSFEEVKPLPSEEVKPVEPEVKQEVKKKKERVNWVPPSSNLLNTYETQEAAELNAATANTRMEIINRVLSNFKIRAACKTYTIGPSVTRYNIEYDADVPIKVLEKHIDDIALRLGGVAVRFTPIVPGEMYSGLEVPNATITMVGFKEVFDALPDVKKHPLAVPFGKNISGEVVYADYNEFPHLLVAGTTGSGKSIYIHSIIATLIMRVSPDDLKIVLVDPKKVEMTKYKDMPHLLCPIINEAEKVKNMLKKMVEEMEDRYSKFADAMEVSDIKQYNEWAKANGKDTLPYILIVLDEYADLIDTCKEISQPVVSLAQKSRACGIYLLISTQRPSANVVTGVIKGNLPTHVALMTSNAIDSITIIGEGGAEKLLGKGDMLVQSPIISRVGVVRLQGCFVHNKEISHIVGYLKEHYETNYDENFLDLIDHAKEEASAAIASGAVEKEADAAEEAKYQSIKEWVMGQEFVSMSKIQRDCGVGFNRAGRFFNRLQKEGIVSTQQDGTTKGCRVLVHGDYYQDEPIVTSEELIH